MTLQTAPMSAGTQDSARTVPVVVMYADIVHMNVHAAETSAVRTAPWKKFMPALWNPPNYYLARTVPAQRCFLLARAQRDNRLLVQLGKAITAWRPRCPVFRKDVTLRTDFRVVIEKTCWNPGPQTVRFRHRRGRTAKPTERTTISGWLLLNRQLEYGDVLAPLHEAEVGNSHTDFGEVRRTG